MCVLQRSTSAAVTLASTVVPAVSLLATMNASASTEKQDSIVRQVGGIYTCVVFICMFRVCLCVCVCLAGYNGTNCETGNY